MKTKTKIILMSLLLSVSQLSAVENKEVNEKISLIDTIRNTKQNIIYKKRDKLEVIKKVNPKELEQKEEELYKSLEKEMNDLLYELEGLKKTNKQIAQENSEIQVKSDLLKNENKEIKKEEIKTKSKNKELKGNNELLSLETKEKSKKIDFLNKTIVKKENHIKVKTKRNNELLSEISEDRETAINSLNKYIYTREYKKANAIYNTLKEQMFLTDNQTDDYYKMIKLIIGFKKHMVLENKKINFDIKNKDMLLLTLKRGMEYLTSKQNRLKLMEATWTSKTLSKDEKHRVLSAFEVSNNNLTRALYNIIKIDKKTPKDKLSEKRLFIILEKIEKTQNGGK